LNIQKPKRDLHKQTGSVSGSIEPFFKSFIRSHFERKYIEILKICNMTWMTGFSSTITKEPIRERCVVEERLWKLWKMAKNYGRRKI